MKKKSILLADDEEEIRELIKEHFDGKEKFRFESTKSGEEAWDKLHQHSYDLVITDYWMQNGDGEELLSRIRDHEVLKNIPVIVITAVDQNLPAWAAANSVLPKPFSMEQLENTIDQQFQIQKLKSRLGGGS
jgi:CheY-like chemotaxis protein